MKRNSVVYLACTLLLVLSISISAKDEGSEWFHCFQSDDVDFRIDDGSIIFESKEFDDEYVEFTRDHKLIVNGKKVRTTDEEDGLIEDFYDLTFQVIHDAKKLGIEGAKIGLAGAHIGLKAISGVFKMIFTDYDSDKLEREMEAEAEKVEKRAEKLEKRAERLEERVEELEDIHDEMVERISELRRLDWF
jgi:dsDNA-specific endonuclease/ATPase MutS2